ncbi:AmpD protein [Bathymodiolus platifrons methanotrophic gill symbiont]|uniref:1,6-anhydro-N-acetylmuramyl-L-alanine amidase AmpD n=1 Tax=Bathymodiolus platifrons methanotrophic gill symbiont TaxID=113268 RepID=UPI000B40DEAE|nr:1,6-anhydro-N-acetylmuramyl-L-alanine amidase AmpD [Bathymodiolus platifrons methanotrophic gill symbiont]MCK5870620.1 1,6-anhydro-N-acetylmuramyl-L-alanine amidase AmpD [Methyloprofundus sp.]TXK97488.1 N-acetylmuramoyl-L-alanine amidase [Methylococcaceae bacterium CS5]TXK97535.1 N-acetylmuramoyl-L-alanine amidase [Methylococcaceae bacterium CS4]TXL04214.1 N-acetylmuramoyl-L-alanine amidase [Methylococcaceae bacterium CS1]TXL05404.1 N-acetylmuramoyl-L-alanine amidase [Methylococcaceae bacte
MIINNHWLTSAQKTPSPNCDHRGDKHDISLIVIHCISLPEGQFGTPFIEQLFTNQLDALAHPGFSEICQLHVSSHIVIDRNGLITQYVPFNKRAWHAGKSEYKGREKCNDFSIGIELEGTDCSPYSEIQYVQLASLIQCLMQTYPKLSLNNITGHSDIAPQRKTDPGKYFDWKKLSQLLKAIN